jgi:hypothetical protein
MKKRLISLFLALTILCTGFLFAGCGNENAPEETKVKTTFEIINEALEKTANLESMAAEMKMEMTMAAEGMTMLIPMTMKLKAKDMKSESPVISMVVSMTMLGQDIDVELYQEGQWAYMVMGDMKYKTDAKDMEGEYDYAESADDMLQQIPEELLKDAELVKAEDGSQSVTISFPEEKFAEIYDDFIESVNSDTEVDVGVMKIADPVVKITMSNGYITVYDIAFTMEMTVEGVTSSTEVKATLTYEDPGQEVTITPPEGYQEFEEMDGEISQ